MFKKKFFLCLIFISCIFSLCYCKKVENTKITHTPSVSPLLLTPSQRAIISTEKPYPAASGNPITFVEPDSPLQSLPEKKTPLPSLTYSPPVINMYQEINKRMIIKEQSGDYNIEVDLAKQVLYLHILPVTENGNDKKETILYPTLKELLGNSPFISASIISAKAKQFDDGLYGGVEIAAENGTGDFIGKKELVVKIHNNLKQLDLTEDVRKARAFILAAAELGGSNSSDREDVLKISKHIKEEFLKNELLSKPIGFYTWSRELEEIFRQDRFLQTPMTGEYPYSMTDPVILAQALVNSDEINNYIKFIKLNEKLTNPSSEVTDSNVPCIKDLSQTAEKSSRNVSFAFFPPSRSRETDLIKKLFPGDEPPPDNFNLADVLIEEIKAGKIQLKPGKDSGWYDYQTYSLEPLVLPGKFPETKKMEFSEEYKKELLNLFKSLFALMRETHVKQLEIPVIAKGCAPGEMKPEIHIYPNLSVEPLMTCYLRRAESYNFIHKALADIFGVENLKKIHRLTPEGSVERNLDDELTSMESLFYGLSLIVALQTGCDIKPDFTPSVDKNIAVNTALQWIKQLDKDRDVYRDNRMMVPVFYDNFREKTKVWVFLGYEKKPLSVSFKSRPEVKIYDKKRDSIDKNSVDIIFMSERRDLIYPVFAEIYVKKILNREEFRNLCDRYGTRSEILKALEN